MICKCQTLQKRFECPNSRTCHKIKLLIDEIELSKISIHTPVYWDNNWQMLTDIRREKDAVFVVIGGKIIEMDENTTLIIKH